MPLLRIEIMKAARRLYDALPPDTRVAVDRCLVDAAAEYALETEPRSFSLTEAGVVMLGSMSPAEGALKVLHLTR